MTDLANMLRLDMKMINQPGPVSAALLVVLFLNGCGERSSQTKTETTAVTSVSTVAAQNNSVCYQQIMGRDTTKVNLFINGSAVTGELAVLPAEKDRAQGSFSGTMTDSRIVADWQRSGEGVTQSHEINFTMVGDSLLWREGERVEKQGKWVLVTPNQGFQYKLTKVDCP